MRAYVEDISKNGHNEIGRGAKMKDPWPSCFLSTGVSCAGALGSLGSSLGVGLF